ncbi:protein of unknown function DUF676 [Trypanosoma melophagium]|uniref:protein of unknown function DUF676 n=1 Tax=Trypanosoma melophagium TaxID=715481 RepID=UPI00351A3722|nr:protein of unknown function DUF676 [Trypanosoma melophagium]
MSAIDQSEFHHFVLFQHGFWAASSEFDGLLVALFQDNEKSCSKDHKESVKGESLGSDLPSEVTHSIKKSGGRLFSRGNLTCFTPDSNRYLGTHQSTCSCACKSLEEFLPVFNDWMEKVKKEKDNCRLCFSCVGHSFGGIIMRELVYLLLVTEDINDCGKDLFDSIKNVRENFIKLNITLENFITIATPHCGVDECLIAPMYYGARIIAMLCAPSLRELLLKDNNKVLAVRLVNSGHLASLRLFRRRTLFANTQKDIMVGFATASLLFSDTVRDRVRIIGTDPKDLPCAAEFADDCSTYSAVIHLPRLEDEVTVETPSHTLNDLNQLYNNTVIQEDIESSLQSSSRLIAASLRRHLDWNLIALRYTHPIPLAHVSCLGRLTQYGSTPEIVRRIAQEIIKVY